MRRTQEGQMLSDLYALRASLENARDQVTRILNDHLLTPGKMLTAHAALTSTLDTVGKDRAKMEHSRLRHIAHTLDLPKILGTRVNSDRLIYFYNTFIVEFSDWPRSVNKQYPEVDEARDWLKKPDGAFNSERIRDIAKRLDRGLHETYEMSQLAILADLVDAVQSLSTEDARKFASRAIWFLEQQLKPAVFAEVLAAMMEH